VEELGLANRVLATVHTGGKALGVGGAWVAGSQALIDWLVNHARSFIYSTAIAPALACGMRAAVQRCATQGAVVAELHAKAGRLRQRLRAAGVDLAASESCILPVILGSSDRAMSVAAALRQDGFDVRAVRPPTVAEGTARLRVTVRGPVAEADFDRFATRLLALQELG
jgi:8-amino-7-oxononanoate synthase